MIITTIWFYIGDIFIFGMLFSILSKLYKKTPVINWERTLRTVKSEKVKKIIEIIYLIVMLIFFFVCFQDIVVPSVKDLPRVVTGTYEKERGYIERIGSRTVYIRSEDRHIIDITIRRREAMEFEEGEEVIVWYYPNPDKPEKFILYISPLCYSKEKGGFPLCYLRINTLIKFTASLPVMTA